MPAEEDSPAPEAVPGGGGNATACPQCSTPECCVQERHAFLQMSVRSCVKLVGELSAKIKGCFPCVLVLRKSALSVEICKLLRCRAALYLGLHGLLTNLFSDIWRDELGVASGMDLFRASGFLLSLFISGWKAVLLKKKKGKESFSTCTQFHMALFYLFLVHIALFSYLQMCFFSYQ